ncbi:MAG: PepSY domain-containing protein [Patescibacteria group bacterium]
MKQSILIFSVLFGLFLIPTLVNGQLPTTAATKMIEISPTEIINYQCPTELVNCIIGTVPQSYTGNDGCTHWKCVPQTTLACPVGCVCRDDIITCPIEPDCKAPCVKSGDSCTCPVEPKPCPVGCICSGEGITCPVESMKPIEVKISSESGTKIVSIKKAPNGLSLQSEKATAITREKLVIEENKLSLKTSTGNKEIKILPEEASSKATAVTSVNTIELKEEYQQPIYSIKGTKQAKLLFVIPVSMHIETKVSAESGNVISVKKPWWSFLSW